MTPRECPICAGELRALESGELVCDACEPVAVGIDALGRLTVEGARRMFAAVDEAEADRRARHELYPGQAADLDEFLGARR